MYDINVDLLDVTPCGLVGINQHFLTYCFHLQRQKVDSLYRFRRTRQGRSDQPKSRNEPLANTFTLALNLEALCSSKMLVSTFKSAQFYNTEE
jgi:hypothetical protein